MRRLNKAAGAMLFAFVMLAAATDSGAAQHDPLPSWNDGPTKDSIIQFVRRVTTAAGPDFVPVAERVATFDNDGCLWSEKPFYFQLAFAIDRVKALAGEHPEWKTTQPFRAVLRPSAPFEFLDTTGCTRQSLAENAMSRFKGLLGAGLSARGFDNQRAEALIKCEVLNRMLSLGMPDSVRV